MARAPLADRMRPTTLDEVVGQDRWLGPGGALAEAVARQELFSLVLWGPPGCGKTTLARILARSVGAHFVALSAVLDGVKRLREVIAEVSDRGPLDPRDTVVFVDEIHRWNKAQQDALLPHVEAGTIHLLGATTENPAFSLNPALRSRLRVIGLSALSTDDVLGLLQRALAHPDGLDRPDLEVEEGVLERLATAAAGDARRALGDLERCVQTLPADHPLTWDHAEPVLADPVLRHDRGGDDHYNVLSALIKSLRGSDPDAGLYWLARLLAGGEDPVSIARRLVIFASEDVGNADPRGLSVAVDAARAVQLVGMPEARIVLGQAVTWLACCPKSNAAYKGIGEALADVERTGALPVPLHLRNPVSAETRAEGWGDGYRYPHDFPHHVVAQTHRPEAVEGRRYYRPADHGEERTIRRRLAWWEAKLQGGSDEG